MERSQFTFYASFSNALQRIRKKADRADAYDAVIHYALYGTEPDMDKLPDSAAIAFELIKPNLDASRRKAENGKRGGRGKQTESKPEANRKQGESPSKKENEIEIEKENENELENECYPPNPLPAPKRSETLAYFMDRVNATPSQTCVDELLGYESTLGTAICKKAIDVALDEKKTGWSYIRAILWDKQKRGIKTLAGWQADEEKRRASRQQNTGPAKTAGSLPGTTPHPEADNRAKERMERLKRKMQAGGEPLEGNP